MQQNSLIAKYILLKVTGLKKSFYTLSVKLVILKGKKFPILIKWRQFHAIDFYNLITLFILECSGCLIFRFIIFRSKLISKNLFNNLTTAQTFQVDSFEKSSSKVLALYLYLKLTVIIV